MKLFIGWWLLLLVVTPAVSIIPVPPGLVGVGILFNGLIDDASFSSILDQGRIGIEEYFGRDRIITDYVQGFVEGFDTNNTASPACLRVVKDFWEKGYQLIIAPGGYSACLEMSHSLPGLHILRVGESAGVDLSTSRFASFERLSTAFVRIWEARFASGIIAGAYTRTGRICFVVGFRNRLSVRDTLALHLGANLTRPGVQTYFMTAGGFDNSTLARIASETLIEKYNCDVLVGRTNRPVPSQVAARYNLSSLHTDGDARVLVGESVLSSILFRWDNAFRSAVSRILGNWTRFDYEGGFGDGTLQMAPFGNNYRLNETARQLVENTLNWYYAAVRNGTHNGFCNVAHLGLQHAPGTNCLPDNVMKFWPMENLTNKGFVSFDIFDVGDARINVTEIFVRWGDPISIVYVTIAIVCMLFVCAMAIITFYFSSKRHPAFQYASPPFLYLVCLGGFLGIVPVFLVGGNRPSDATCNSALWIFAIGLNVCYSAILVKAGRLWWILRKARSAIVVSVPNRELMIYFVIQLFSMLLILVLGTSFKAYIANVRTDARLPEFSFHVFCQPNAGTAWAIALVVYQAVQALVGLFLALKTRHMYDELNESREIVIITYNVLFVGIAFIILLNILDATPIVIYAIECTGAIWISVFTVVVIYFPKVYHVLTGKPYYSNNGLLSSANSSPMHSRGMSAMSDVPSTAAHAATSALSDAIDHADNDS